MHAGVGGEGMSSSSRVRQGGNEEVTVKSKRGEWMALRERELRGVLWARGVLDASAGKGQEDVKYAAPRTRTRQGPRGVYRCRLCLQMTCTQTVQRMDGGSIEELQRGPVLRRQKQLRQQQQQQTKTTQPSAPSVKPAPLPAPPCSGAMTRGWGRDHRFRSLDRQRRGF